MRSLYCYLRFIWALYCLPVSFFSKKRKKGMEWGGCGDTKDLGVRGEESDQKFYENVFQ